MLTFCDAHGKEDLASGRVIIEFFLAYGGKVVVPGHIRPVGSRTSYSSFRKSSSRGILFAVDFSIPSLGILKTRMRILRVILLQDIDGRLSFIVFKVTGERI